MSYVLTPYLLDVDEFGRALGSGDESLISAVIASNPKPFQAVDDEGGITLTQALRDLVMGGEPAKDSEHRYLRALMLLCDRLGEKILPGAWGGVRWIAVTAVGVDDFVMRGCPPGSPSQVPNISGIGYMTADEVVAKIPEVDEALATEEDEDLQELRSELKSWLLEAASKKKGIVFVYA
jgi:hypothetical protein